MNVKAYLEITMKIDAEKRPAAAKVYTDYRQPFLDTIEGSLTKRSSSLDNRSYSAVIFETPDILLTSFPYVIYFVIKGITLSLIGEKRGIKRNCFSKNLKKIFAVLKTLLITSFSI